MTQPVYQLRSGISLSREPNPFAPGSERHWLNDPATGRRVAVAGDETAVVAGLLRGVQPGPLQRLLDDAGVECTAAEYAALYGELHLLDDGADPRGAVRRSFRADHWGRIRRTLADAAERIPYYRHYWQPGPSDTLAEFRSNTPILTRDEYRKNFPERLLPRGTSYFDLLAHDAYQAISSSGSTGERVQVIHSRPYLRRVFNSYYLTENVFEAPHAIFGPLQCMAVECFKEVPSFAERYSGHALSLAAPDVMQQTPTRAEALLAELSRTGIRVVLANPFYVAYTTYLATRAGNALPALDDVLLSYDYAQATTRAYLRQTYGVTPRDLYGMTEGGLQLMRSCRRGSVHLNEELFHLEFEPWNDDCRRLVFTTLANELTPLIRYQTTDLFELGAAEVDDAYCACGSPLRHVGAFNGRIRDALRYAGGVYPLGVIDRGIDAIDGVVMYRLELAGDQFAFLYVGEAEAAGVTSLVSDRLAGVFGCRTEVAAHRVSSIPLDRTGKFQTIVARGSRSRAVR